MLLVHSVEQLNRVSAANVRRARTVEREIRALANRVMRLERAVRVREGDKA